MDISKCKELTSIEFGSTYQGTSDEYSDLDLMFIVQQPLEDVIFRNNEKASYHSGDVRYYSVERFVSLVLKGGFDNILLLCAQLEQAEGSEINKKILHHFYDRSFFSIFVRSKFKEQVYSVCGQLNKYMNKDHLTGKENVKAKTFMYHLNKYKDILDNFDNYIDYTTFSKVDLPSYVIDTKRSGDKFYIDKDYAENLIQEVKSKLNENKTTIKKLRKLSEHVEQDIKQDVTRFLIAEKLKEIL